MTIELTSEEKIQIINSHIKNIAFAKYNSEIDLIQENAKKHPLAENIASYQAQIDQAAQQLTAIQAELAKVQSETESSN
jgi:hypothetical protein